MCGWLVVFFPCFPFEGPCAYLMSTLDSPRVLFGGFSMLWCLSIKKKKKHCTSHKYNMKNTKRVKVDRHFIKEKMDSALLIYTLYGVHWK